ncbi:hypothetical protein [Paenibacillus turpanensis]|uniref:hypothetical protein n=1 Tax=Paenibacillus turpanensis TaxID=2689078 RepID=UPI00140BADC5|nr:hypothetical protein [Paenibacillus turpanensis]
MWNAIPVSWNMYGFEPEHGNPNGWTATAYVKENETGIEIYTDICLSYVKGNEEYERLLEAIRDFAAHQSKQTGKLHCMIRFQCSGLVEQGSDIPLPDIGQFAGRRFGYSQFSEELTSA